MPRKEGPSIEERMQRARELAEINELEEQDLLKKLYASALYRYTRKSCIAFLWISQLLLIDWALPYLEEQDKIAGGYFNSNTMLTHGVGGITDFKLNDLFIRTEKGYGFKVDFPDNTREPTIGDNIVLLKSMIFHDYKKVAVPRIDESFYVSTSATYRFLPFVFIISALAVLFIFVKNIEVKAFAWLALGATSLFGLFLIGYMIASFQ